MIIPGILSGAVKTSVNVILKNFIFRSRPEFFVHIV